MSAAAMRAGKPDSGNGTRENARPLISIAMCTYNGEAYLSQQLISISKQTQQPDELVICDDGSTDNTLQILEKIRKEDPFPVRLYRNEQRLGPTKNFQKAISLCTGDFIFLSDQDDVWMPEKVNKLLQALMNNPGAGYVFSDALIVDEILRPMGYTMWQTIKFTPGQRRQFEHGKQLEILLKHDVVTGATMAIRANLRRITLPIPNEYVHDEWIPLLASSAGMCGVLIEEPLVQYRQHSEQLIGCQRLSFIEKVKQARVIKGESLFSKEEVKCSKALDRLMLIGQLTKEAQQSFNAKIQHLQARQSLHKYSHYHPQRLIGISREFLKLHYNRFSDGWKSMARDLLL